MARRPASRSSGLSTGIATMVVQFGLATMPLGMRPEVVGVDLGHHERHVGVHAPGRGVVDDRSRPRLGDPGRERPGGGGAGREQRDVEAGVVGGLGVLHLDLAVAEAQASARRIGPRRTAGARRRGTGPLGEHAAHDPADLTGCPERFRCAWTTGYGVAPRGPKPYGGAIGGHAKGAEPPLTRSARRRRGGPARPARPGPRRTTQLIRIAEVEIISMLMPAAARVSNTVAATPGFDFMPAPTTLTRAMSPSLVHPGGADLRGRAPTVISWLGRGRRGGR